MRGSWRLGFGMLIGNWLRKIWEEMTLGFWALRSGILEGGLCGRLRI